MNIVFVLVPLALLIFLIGLGAFIWAVMKGQYDDLDTPAWKVLENSKSKKGQKE